MLNTTEEEKESDMETNGNDIAPAVPLTERRDYFSFLEINVKSHPKSIHDLVKKMRVYFLELGIERDIVEDLVLLIDEAVTNTAEHAHQYDPERDVEIKITIKPSKIQMLVKGVLKSELINNHRFTDFIKRLIKEKIISQHKAHEFLKEFVSQEFLTEDRCEQLREEFRQVDEAEEIVDIDCLLQDYLDERGRGIILISQLTDGKVKVDIIGRTLTIVMTKNLKLTKLIDY